MKIGFDLSMKIGFNLSRYVIIQDEQIIQGGTDNEKY